MRKRILSLTLTLALLLSVLPLGAFNLTASAASENGFTYTVSYNEAKIALYTGTATNLVIPDTLGGYSVTSIGTRAFSNCTALQSIEIPNSVTSIGTLAFSNCTALQSVTIGNGVTSIGDYAFYDCNALQSITVAENNQNYSSADGVLFNKDKTTIICYPCGKPGAVYTIPNSVTSIGTQAFSNCTALQSIEIPNSVTSIGNDAFEGCTALQGITIPSSVTYIGGWAFFGCSALKSIEIPNSVTSISSKAFAGCTALQSVTIGNGVTSIGDAAFEGCTALQSITIGNRVKYIGWDAFTKCTALQSVNITDLKAWCEIGFGDYYGNPLCYAEKIYLNNILITDLVIPDSVTSITSFENCTALKSIEIPDSVKYIGESAFYNTAYYNSQNNWQNEVLYIGNHLIEAKNGITSCNIKTGTKTIADSAFGSCTALKSIKMPNSVTYICDWAFGDCTALKSVTIGNGVTSIGGAAFEGCTSLEGIYITDLKAWCEIDFVSDYSNPLSYAKKLYLNNVLITDLVIPDGVTSIGTLAFSNCTALQSIEIPNSVTSISSKAFAGCTALQSVTIGNGVTSIGNDAFEGCTALRSVYITDLKAWCEIDFDSYYSNPLSYAKKLYLNNVLITDLVIPDGVTSIGTWAFSGCTALQSIEIPNSVTSIGTLAFYGCTALQSIEIPNSVTSIGAQAFDGCTALQSIEIPNSFTYIGILAFSGCTALQSIEIPNSVTSIGTLAFSNCTALQSITIPDSVTSIHSSAFYGCTALKYVFYSGTEQDKANITIGSDNEKLTSAAWHYNATDHNYGAEYVSKPATFTADGVISKKCEVCSLVQVENYSIISRIDTVQLITSEFEYTGNEFKPAVIVTTLDGSTITADNYTVAYSNNTEVGTATATVTFKNKYSGTKTLTFKIYGDVANAEVKGVTDRHINDTTQSPVVTFAGKTLIKGTDYTFTNVVDGLVGTVTIEGKGNYRGTKVFNYSISDHNYGAEYVSNPATSTQNGTISKQCGTCQHIEDVSTISRINTVQLITSEFEYTGNEFKPALIITALDGSTITADNYTVAYSNNTEVGKATATVTFKNKYSGTKTLTFKIYGDVANATVKGVKDCHINDTTQNPVVTFADKTLAEGTDYTFTNAQNGLVGTVTIKGKGNYLGTKVVNYSISGHNYGAEYVSKPATSTQNGTISKDCSTGSHTDFVSTISRIKTVQLITSEFEYTGNEFKPALIITALDGSTITSDNYTVAYSNNTEVGTATATITFKNKYSGSRTVYFDIYGNVSKAEVTGVTDRHISDNMTQTPTVTFAGETLVEGTDYTFTNAQNSLVGTVTIEGKGNYRGTKVVNYSISDHNYGAEYVSQPATSTENGTISKQCGTCQHIEDVSTISKINWVDLNSYQFEYTGSSITPVVTVTAANGSTITTDNYTVVYNNNIAVGTANATITLKNKYSGSRTLYFDIYGNVSKAEVTGVTDRHINDRTTQDPVVSYGGKILIEGVDYTFTNYVNEFIGTVTITGRGDYRGTKVVNYSISDHDYYWIVDTVETCNDSGTKHEACSVDGCTSLRNLNTPIPATRNHNYTWVIDTHATCGVAGTMHMGCTVCGNGTNFFTPIAATGFHISDSGSVTKKATELSEGEKTYRCTICNTILKTEKIAKLPKPKTVTTKSVKSQKKATVKITWKKDSKVKGYQIVYATNKKFTKGKKTITIKSNKTTSKTIKKLKSKKTYYVKVRSYKVISGKKVYGAFSKVKKVKIK